MPYQHGPIFFLRKVWVITSSNHAQISLGGFIGNGGLLLATFCTFLTLLTLLTYSAMVDITRYAKSHKIDLYWWILVRLLIISFRACLRLVNVPNKGCSTVETLHRYIGGCHRWVPRDISGCVTESQEWIGIPQNSWKRANQAHRRIPGKADKNSKKIQNICDWPFFMIHNFEL